MATGFHGFHVFVGTIALFISFIRVILNHFTNKHHFGFESAIWYWHFVDGAGVKHVTYRLLWTYCSTNFFCKLKGRVRYLGSVLESLLRVVFNFIYQIILSAQKAAVKYLSRIHVYLKRNKLRLQNRTIVPLLNSYSCCGQTHRLLESEGFREYRIRSKVGNKFGILHMRTSHGLSVAGESRKYFSISLSMMKTGSASNSKIIKKEVVNPCWFRNDNKLFERVVSVEALKRA